MELKLFVVILCQVESFMSYDMQDIVMSLYVTSCHGVWWDFGFENVKHGLISYNGNQGRGISVLHICRLSQSDFQGEWIVYTAQKKF